ncbi:MAG: phage major capsid protein [Betaproteobacteria bacterium]
MKDTMALRRKRAELVAQGRAIIDAADAEKRELTAEEGEQWDRIMAEVKKLGAEIDREEQMQALERETTGSLGTVAARQERPGGAAPENHNPRATDEYRAAYARFLRGGAAALRPDDFKALQADVDTAGGYIKTPQQFLTQLLKKLDDTLFIRRLATKFQVEKADSLGVPVLDSDPADAEWTTELATGGETDMAFGKRELKTYPLAKRIKLSNKLLRQAVIDVEALVRDRLAYKFGVAEEKAFMTGDGVGKPLGIFVASANGISTARDVSDGNTATSITFDGLKSAKYALKQSYWRNAQWAFHRDAVAQLAKIKDNEGQYIWSDSVRDGEPDRLLGFPVNMSEYIPNTFTTGMYVGVLADFSYYWIVDSLDMTIQRLVELYAETNQVGFIGRRELDGAPVLEEAFVRVKLA